MKLSRISLIMIIVASGLAPLGCSGGRTEPIPTPSSNYTSSLTGNSTRIPSSDSDSTQTNTSPPIAIHTPLPTTTAEPTWIPMPGPTSDYASSLIINPTKPRSTTRSSARTIMSSPTTIPPPLSTITTEPTWAPTPPLRRIQRQS